MFMRLQLSIALFASATVVMAAKPLKLRTDNIAQIVKAMTLEEKAQMVVGCSSSAFVGFGNSTLYVPGSAASTAMIERLGIPPTVLADGPAGLRISPKREGTDQTYYCTAFPIGTSLASTWSPELVEQVGAVIGEETREYGVDVLLAPGLNLQRDPLCGRNFEYYSEDPLVSGKVAAAYIRGVQSQGVGTSAKHYAVNNAETNRKASDSRLDERTLRELYLKGFEIAVKEAQPWTVMTAYNAVNGVQSMEHRELLHDILRGEWGFDGYVMCDWAYAGLRNTVRELYAGNDLLTPGSDQQRQEVIDAVNKGELQMADLDACVEHILSIVVKSQRYKGYKYSDKPDLTQHARVARQAAAEGIVLLQNHDQTLPLGSERSSLGLFGISSYDFVSGGTGSGSVNMSYVVNLKQALTQIGYTVNSALEQYYTHRVELAIENLPSNYGLGRTSLREVDIDRKLIEQSAEQDAMAIVTLGRDVAGKEVVQLYVSAPAGGLDKPACELRSFGKTQLLQPGESQTLTFDVDAYSLASYNPTSHRWETAAGDYKLSFAANVEDVRAEATVRLEEKNF